MSPPKRRSRREWSDVQKLQLATGHDYLHETSWGNSPTVDDLAEMKTAWKDTKDEIIAEHIAKHPCTRPWAWWKFGAPEPRDESQDEKVQLHLLGIPSGQEYIQFERLESLNRYRSQRSGLDA